MTHNDSPQPRLDPTDAPHPLGPYNPGQRGRPRGPQPAPTYRGGHTRIDPQGYVLEYAPDHPHATRNGYMRQHRLVMEGKLGRLLQPGEGHVHHHNENKADNRASNLELLTQGQHMSHHHTGKGPGFQLTDDQVRRALEGRTTQQAADLLGVHHQTLRNHFGHLLHKRTSPGGEYAPHLVEQVRQLAADPTVGTREACRRTGMSQLTMRRLRERHGIEWVSAPRGRPSLRG